MKNLIIILCITGLFIFIFLNLSFKNIKKDVDISKITAINIQQELQIKNKKLKEDILELRDVICILNDKIADLDKERKKDFEAVYEYIKMVTIKILDTRQYINLLESILQGHALSFLNLDNKIKYLEQKIKELENECKRNIQTSSRISTKTSKSEIRANNKIFRTRYKSCCSQWKILSKSRFFRKNY